MSWATSDMEGPLGGSDPAHPLFVGVVTTGHGGAKNWPANETEKQAKNRKNLAAWRARWKEHQARLGQEIDLLNADAKGCLVPPPKVHMCRDCGEVEVRAPCGQCRGCYRTFDEGDGDDEC